MRTLTIMLALCTALCACAAERPPASSQAAPSTEEAAPAGFTPPDGAGFGRVGELVYLEEIFGDATPADTLPMLVLIHGRGDKAARGWLPFSFSQPVRVIMPQAPLPFGEGGWSWFPNRALEATGPGGEDLGRALGERAVQLAAAVAVLQRQRPTKGLPIVGGFSQGGMLSFTLAARHPHAFRAVVPIAGLLPEALFATEAPAPPLPPVLALHGTADPLVPIEGARNAVQHLTKIGYQAELREYPGVEHTITPQMLAVVQGWLNERLGEP